MGLKVCLLLYSAFYRKMQQKTWQTVRRFLPCLVVVTNEEAAAEAAIYFVEVLIKQKIIRSNKSSAATARKRVGDAGILQRVSFAQFNPFFSDSMQRSTLCLNEKDVCVRKWFLI